MQQLKEKIRSVLAKKWLEEADKFSDRLMQPDDRLQKAINNAKGKENPLLKLRNTPYILRSTYHGIISTDPPASLFHRTHSGPYADFRRIPLLQRGYRGL